MGTKAARKVTDSVGNIGSGWRRKSPVPVPVEADQTIKEYLDGCEAAKVEAATATDADLRRWLEEERGHGRDGARLAYHVGRVLLVRRDRDKVPHGQSAAWSKARAAELERKPSIIRLYMQVAKDIGAILPTPLAVSVLDRPLREVPRAIRKVRDGLDPDADVEKPEPTPDEKAARWRRQADRLLKDAVADPDLREALAAFMKAVKEAVTTEEADAPGPDEDRPGGHRDKGVVEPVVIAERGGGKADAPAVVVVDSQSLVVKCLPKRFRDIIGNADAKRALSRLAADRVSRSVIIHGATGTGKTAMALVAALSHQCEGERGGGFEPCGDCPSCRAIMADPFHYSPFEGRGVMRVSASASKGAPAVEAVIEALNYQYAALIVDEADRMMVQHEQLLPRLDKPLPFPVFFTTVKPEAFDAQFKGRCTVVETTPPSDDELIKYLKRIALAEGHPLDHDGVKSVMHALRKRGVVGQVRDALVELEKFLRTQ